MSAIAVSSNNWTALSSTYENGSFSLEVYYSARATITKYYRLDGLNYGNLFYPGLKAGSPRWRCYSLYLKCP
jgi:hypothetical protein